MPLYCAGLSQALQGAEHFDFYQINVCRAAPVMRTKMLYTFLPWF